MIGSYYTNTNINTEPEQPQYFGAPNTVYIVLSAKDFADQHQHRGDGGNNVGDDDNEGNNNDGAGLLEKEEGEKEVIVIATNK